ncbi:hypothetical protein BH18ACI2_BH18ACI2_18940 [soil metagenome]
MAKGRPAPLYVFRYFTDRFHIFGSVALLLPLANSVSRTGCIINFTKDVCLVCAGGTSASQLATRTKLIAVAVSTCCKCVLAPPK